jgi:hypothetical protein
VDAYVFSKKGKSIYSESRRRFILLFIYSIPFWWLFELINLRTHYWFYVPRKEFSDLEYALLASLSFSTVIPAILETYDLLSLLKIFQKEIKWIRINTSIRNFLILFFIGVIMFILLLMYPQQLPYFMWISLFFVFELVNYLLKLPTMLEYTAKRNWTPLLQLFLAGFCCGLLWEMWNYYSYPKWKYHLPGFEYLYVFEMPLAGYLGYLPFALELWAYYHLVDGLFNKLFPKYLRHNNDKDKA